MDESKPSALREKAGEKSLSGAIREVIFGAADGLVSTLGLVTGVAAGTTQEEVVILAGVAGALSGAVSMASGNYLGVKSHIEVLERRLQDEERSIYEDPHLERAELVDYYRERGLSQDEISVIVPAILRNKDLLMEEMAAHELGISRDELSNPLWRAFWIFIAFILSAGIPVFPYALFEHDPAMVVSISGTVLALFAVGAARTKYTGRNWIRSGLEMLAVAALAGVVGYIAGRSVGI